MVFARAIYLALFRYNTNNEKVDWMLAQYLARIKGIARQLSASGEEDLLLQISEARLSRYNQIHDLWREAHERGRGHEQTFAIG